MDNPTPAISPAEFGSYPNYFAVRVGRLRAAREMSRTETAGRFARTEEEDDFGEEPAVIGKIGHFANLSAGSLRELQTGLWGTDV